MTSRVRTQSFRFGCVALATFLCRQSKFTTVDATISALISVYRAEVGDGATRPRGMNLVELGCILLQFCILMRVLCVHSPLLDA